MQQQDIYYDQVIEAAYLHGKPNCYFIGPFARRVSFASQQRRALDLVEGLARKGRLEKDGVAKTIAVVGAGAAGLTAAVALRGRGCKVHIYERNASPLEMQALAEHRVIHPSIARWPADPLHLTTDFGFMNWFAGPADVVVRSLRQTWERWLAPKPGQEDYRFFPGITVDELMADDEGVHLGSHRTPGLELPPLPPAIVHTRYDCVFVTTGFDIEDKAGVSSATSYWSPQDMIDEWRRDERKIFISGCGDGGLIDALRLVHAHFDRGWLTVRVAQAITQFHGEIAEAEEQALMAAKSLACMNLSQPAPDDLDPTRKIGARFEDETVVRKLTQFYVGLAQRLPRPVVELLDDSLARGGMPPGRVVLFSRQPHPFGPYAAPIHKIMVQHALQSKHISYVRGEQIDRPPYGAIDWPEERYTQPLTAKDGLVVRHGSAANLGDMVRPAARESLRIRQFMLTDYMDTSQRRTRPPPDFPEMDDPRYAAIHLDMASELIGSLLPNATVDAVANPPGSGDDVGAIFQHTGGDVALRSPSDIAIPEKLFGIPLVDAPRMEVNWL